VASFQGLGQLPGGLQSYAFGVSGDGKVVVGWSLQGTNELRAWRWTAATGMQDLGDLGGGSAEAHAANADGSIVVGRSWDNSPGLGYHGFRWTASGGMEALPTAEGRDVSADGSVVVGGAVWTQSGGLHPPLGPCCQSAEGVSPDGGTITGWTSTSNGIRAFHWTAATGVRDLGTLGGSESAGEDASLNGSVVVGQARNGSQFWRAFRWTASTGMQDLGSLGGPMARAFAISDNGSVIVGRALTSSSSASEAAFRWTATKKMENLKRVLLNAGLTSVQNWTLTTASRASADGTVIVGFGRNPSSQWESFRAVLPVP
jgi:probable HAF family extracellular repeat protein